jgi:hypothetical protein
MSDFQHQTEEPVSKDQPGPPSLAFGWTEALVVPFPAHPPHYVWRPCYHLALTLHRMALSYPRKSGFNSHSKGEVSSSHFINEDTAALWATAQPRSSGSHPARLQLQPPRRAGVCSGEDPRLVCSPREGLLTARGGQMQGPAVTFFHDNVAL